MPCETVEAGSLPPRSPGNPLPKSRILCQGGEPCQSPSGGSPPRLTRRSVKLTELWNHLPQVSRQRALQAAIRMLKARVSPSSKEVTHEDS